MHPDAPRPAPLVGVVLAAGASTRMGRSKALLDLDGAPLVTRHVLALARVCEQVLVVVGAQAAAVVAALPPSATPVHNAAFAETGPRESLLLALRAMPDEALAFVTPVDVPPAPDEVLRALLAAGGAAVPTFDGQDGHPVLIAVGDARRRLAAGHTLKDALERATRVPVTWPDTARNLNTPTDWSDWLAGRRRMW